MSPSNDRSGKKEGQQELDVDPYVLLKSLDILPKPQSLAKETKREARQTRRSEVVKKTAELLEKIWHW